MAKSPSARLATLWSQGVTPDALMMAYTVGDDRSWDARLLRWDILGSLGHIEGLRASGLLSAPDYARLRAALRQALAAASAGRLTITEAHEDAHSAVEDWLTRRHPDAGARVHTGRSRNDQVACDLRLYLKDTLLGLHNRALDLADALLGFAATWRTALWPGYTHQRRAMPSSGGLWAAGLAEGVLTSVELLPALWARIDRSPLGSAAGYGLPLPLRREAAMRALGFGGLDQVVTSVQLGRGKHEAAVLAWCVDVGHDLSRCAADVILLSAEEFGLLVLPPELGTGSSIMPHKRNPDLFELTRARAAAVEGDLAAVLHLKGKLAGGYHRDFQLLKEPLFRGLDRTGEMLAMLAHAIPKLQVDRVRGLALLRGEALVTDEVMRRVERGVAFRKAYRDVAAEFKDGVIFPVPTVADLMRRRRSTGNLGNLGLPSLRAQARAARRWNRRERFRFDWAMARLAGRRR
jgi:argininosuccinate lyase